MVRNKSLLVRLTDDEHEQLATLAAEAGVSVSNYVRGKVLGSEPAVTRGTPQATYSALASEVRNHDLRFDQIEDQLSQVRALLGGKEA